MTIILDPLAEVPPVEPGPVFQGSSLRDPTDIPHFSYPFNMIEGRVLVREQDSDEEIMDCVEVLLNTNIGERQEIPDYGIHDQAFLLNGVDKSGLYAAVALWVPRAQINLERSTFEDLVETVRVSVKGRANV